MKQQRNDQIDYERPGDNEGVPTIGGTVAGVVAVAIIVLIIVAIYS